MLTTPGTRITVNGGFYGAVSVNKLLIVDGVETHRPIHLE